MFKKTLTSLFNLSARDNGADCLVNYVWINKKPDSARIHACSIPFESIDRAHGNARQYPDARVNIWVDFRYLDDRSRTTFYEHHEKFAPPNVEIADLNDIPQYRDHDHIFAPVEGPLMRTIWARVDFARIVVLDHALKNEPENHVFYADFDIEDVRLKQARKILERYNVALGSAGSHSFFSDGPSILENGYFAFRNGDVAAGLMNTLLNATKIAAEKDRCGYGPPFEEFVEASCAANGLRNEWNLTLRSVMHRQGYKIPHNPKYEKLGWN